MAYKEGQPLMTICYVLVRCWKIRSVYAIWSRSPVLIQPICSPLKILTICTPSANPMQTAGPPKPINSGQQVISSMHHKTNCIKHPFLIYKERQDGDNPESFFFML